MADPSIPGRILTYLNDKGAESKSKGVPPQDVAQHIFGNNAKKKQINPYLYTMLNNGTLSKTCDKDLKRPRWYIA
uniref:Helix-turn-helix domain protein n=1 Tax=Pithovirus LCPAC403 TaxID=2506596 RepID=A0A481ZB86_9VIRU|nr:MAG: helix-turn-helix domain protein [Pithovirus LCPAC403]